MSNFFVPRRDKSNGSLDCRDRKEDFLPEHGVKSVLAQLSSSIREEQLQKALEYMQAALEVLDDADAPADIGAHLEHAITRMRDIPPGSLPDLQ